MHIGDFAGRLEAVSRSASVKQIDGVLVTPGPDLLYLTGYDAKPLERLTCLVIRAGGDPVLVAPGLERLAALASPIGSLGIDVVSWGELDDPYSIVAGLLGTSGVVALDNHMWAEKVLALRAAMPNAAQVLAGSIVGPLRMRKDDAEVAALVEAGAAIDRVHAQVPALLRAGRTEREVGADIADLIISEGHATVDFIIVGSGPNGASPHHEVSDRVLEDGDVIVVDIGGTMPSGYCSDCTRTYALGEPDAPFRAAYDALFAAQAAGVEHVRAGVTCESVDATTRTVLTDAGYGDLFIHRTGHGIGLETHEDPYIVTGNDQALEPGMAFSIEPGFYIEGRYGARIEDIVIATADGVIVANNGPRELQVV
jgi:Xaa-Pro aminopeptidase